WNFPENGAVPFAFYGDLQVVSGLFNAYFGRIIIIAGQEIQIGQIQVRAGNAQKFSFGAGKLQFCHSIHGYLKFTVKAFGEKMFSTVDEFVLHAFIREEFYHGVLHGNFIVIIIQNGMETDLAHRKTFTQIWANRTKKTPSDEASSRFT